MGLEFQFSRYEEFQQNLPLIEDYIMSMSSNEKTRILFSIIEGVNNAFEHGMNENEYFTVELDITDGNNHLEITIINNGSGFDYEDKLENISDPDQFLENNITSERGRGIAIMKKCSHSMHYTDEGRKLTLTFLLE